MQQLKTSFIFADNFSTPSLSAKAGLLDGSRGPCTFFSWAPLVIMCIWKESFIPLFSKLGYNMKESQAKVTNLIQARSEIILIISV